MLALLFMQSASATPPVWLVMTGLIVAVVMNTMGIGFALWRIGYNVGLMAESLKTVVSEVRLLRERYDKQIERMATVEAEIANLQRTVDAVSS